MKTTLLVGTMLVLALATSAGQGKTLTSDPLTNLPLIPATDSGMQLGNEPTQLPAGDVCKSKMQGEFYMLYKIKVDATVAWYSSHITGFKKFQGYASGRSQTIFYNSDGTTVIAVTGEKGLKARTRTRIPSPMNAFSPASPRRRSVRWLTGISAANSRSTPPTAGSTRRNTFPGQAPSPRAK